MTSGWMRDGSISELVGLHVPDGVIEMAGGHADGESNSIFEYQIINVSSILQVHERIENYWLIFWESSDKMFKSRFCMFY